MRGRWLPAVLLLVAAACGDDNDSESAGGAGGSSGGGKGGSAATSSGEGGAPDQANAGTGAEAGSPGAGDGGAGGAGGAADGAVDLGEVAGLAFEARGSSATFSEVPGRGFVSISVNGWEETCDDSPVCGEAQLNFTLHAIGGTLDDIEPGAYAVESTEAGGVTYEIAGAAGRYDGQCMTGDGFARIESGVLTITALEAGRVQGEVDFTLENGDELNGAFDAIDCTL